MSKPTQLEAMRDSEHRYGVRCASATEMAQPMATVLAHYRGRGGTVDPLAICLGLLNSATPKAVAVALAAMTPEWRDHAIACVYALLMPHERRKRLGAYFTPPHVVDHLIGRIAALGVDLAEGNFHDPAAGGAAFIVPLARRMTALWRAAGLRRAAIPKRLAARLTGMEIDPSLAALANALIRNMLVREHRFTEASVSGLVLIRTGDSLVGDREVAVGSHEIGNPPYRRLSAAEHGDAVRRFADITSGRMNLYSMFVRAGLGNAPIGGIVAHVVPASFLSGPEFRAFRKCVLQLADVEVLDLVEARESVFLDALQDACFLILRRRDPERADSTRITSTGVFRSDGSLTAKHGTLLPADGSPWPLPGNPAAQGVTLADLGYRAGVGYLVANRQKHLLYAKPGSNRFPVIWAKAITSNGKLDHARGAKAKGSGWAAAPTGSGVVRGRCVVIQRTSSRSQRRRVYAAPVTDSFMQVHGGFIAENHVLVLRAIRSDCMSPQALAAILNSAAVSDVIDSSCGSASIPAAIFATIRLPNILNFSNQHAVATLRRAALCMQEVVQTTNSANPGHGRLHVLPRRDA